MWSWMPLNRKVHLVGALYDFTKERDFPYVSCLSIKIAQYICLLAKRCRPACLEAFRIAAGAVHDKPVYFCQLKWAAARVRQWGIGTVAQHLLHRF